MFLFRAKCTHTVFSNNWYLMHENILMNLTSTNIINCFSMKHNFSNNQRTLGCWKFSPSLGRITRGFFLPLKSTSGLSNPTYQCIKNQFCSIEFVQWIKTEISQKGWRPHYTQYLNLCIFKTDMLCRYFTKIICCRAGARQEADAQWIDFQVLFVADLRLESISVLGGVVKWMFIV